MSVFALALSAGAALAAPQDYQERLPAAIQDMELVRTEMAGEQLVAYYGETIGRATLRILPAPQADPRGAAGGDPAGTGETPSAQRALFELLAQNLEQGTNALNEGYTTAPVRLRQIEISGDSDLDGTVLICGMVERQQDGGDAGETRGLLDNLCTAQNGSEVIALSITAPYSDDEMQQNLSQAHLAFAGMLIGQLMRP
ncbi:hypothetical protein [Paracoccus sp. (in: a-proteobacteria)]|uniref:hypothetical protein n=1 Tax=Paracoccus sp. TaxID=267 RepID=UPI0026DF1266|nr:hypothetical protein [Paracoccus sp. (in: a-proteobacteria)]